MHRQPAMDHYYNTEILKILNRYKHPDSADRIKGQLATFSNLCQKRANELHKNKKPEEALFQLRCSFGADVLKDHKDFNGFLQRYYSEKEKKELPATSLPMCIFYKENQLIQPSNVEKKRSSDYLTTAKLLATEAIELTNLELQRQAFGRTERTNLANDYMTMAQKWFEASKAAYETNRVKSEEKQSYPFLGYEKS